MFGANGKRREVPLDDAVVRELMDEIELCVRADIGDTWHLGVNTIGHASEEDKLDTERAFHSR